jgi:uncharacterized protein YcnI
VAPPWHVEIVRLIFAPALALALALAAPAAAHMIVLPATSEAGGWERYSLLVPTEKEDTDTVRIELRLPNGMEVVAIEAKPGWKGAYNPFPLGAATVRWEGGRIPPGQMISFEFMAWNPPAPRTVSWDATQWYEDGSSDRWQDLAEDAERPASLTVLQPPAAGAAAAGTRRYAHAEQRRRPAVAGEGKYADARGSADPSFVMPLAFASLALSVTALAVALSTRRRAKGG